LLWRFVYFRIQDWRYPDEPREFPNWIPGTILRVFVLQDWRHHAQS
jgi:hypothetical protein